MAEFASIPAALDALRAGRPVLVLDNPDRENEGDAIVAAGTASSEWVRCRPSGPTVSGCP